MTIRCCVTASQRFLLRAAKPSALPTSTDAIITLALRSSTMAFRGFPIPSLTGGHAHTVLPLGLNLRWQVEGVEHPPRARFVFVALWPFRRLS
jgi:hypothetical protein